MDASSKRGTYIIMGPKVTKTLFQLCLKVANLTNNARQRHRRVQKGILSLKTYMGQ